MTRMSERRERATSEQKPKIIHVADGQRRDARGGERDGWKRNEGTCLCLYGTLGIPTIEEMPNFKGISEAVTRPSRLALCLTAGRRSNDLKAGWLAPTRNAAWVNLESRRVASSGVSRWAHGPSAQKSTKKELGFTPRPNMKSIHHHYRPNSNVAPSLCMCWMSLVCLLQRQSSAAFPDRARGCFGAFLVKAWLHLFMLIFASECKLRHGVIGIDFDTVVSSKLPRAFFVSDSQRSFVARGIEIEIHAQPPPPS